MNLDAAAARERFAGSPVARLATVGSSGMPHVVPITFVVDDDMIFFAIDHKPKRSMNLRRLRNIAENSQVSLLVDHYADDWSRLWWARADGHAEAWEDGDARQRAVRLLQSKYRQYAETPPAGPVVAVRVDAWKGWAYADGDLSA